VISEGYMLLINLTHAGVRF